MGAAIFAVGAGDRRPSAPAGGGGWHDDDVVSFGNDLFVVHHECGLALERDEHLLVGMPMPARSATRRSVDEDHADTDSAVIAAHELVSRQLISLDDLDVHPVIVPPLHGLDHSPPPAG